MFSVFTKNPGTQCASFLLVGCLSVLTSVNAQNATDTLIVKKELQEVRVNGKNKKQLRSAMPTQLLTTHEIEKLNIQRKVPIIAGITGCMVRKTGLAKRYLIEKNQEISETKKTAKKIELL